MANTEFRKKPKEEQIKLLLKLAEDKIDPGGYTADMAKERLKELRQQEEEKESSSFLKSILSTKK